MTSEEEITRKDTSCRYCSLFSDIFHRADRNDDGVISWAEFRSYFADGILSEEYLKDLFQTIDTHHTDNIDTQELCTYVGDKLGKFELVFENSEKLNSSIHQAILQIANAYDDSNWKDQYVTRFLLRETISQLNSVTEVLNQTLSSLEETTLKSTSINMQPLQVNSIGDALHHRSSRRFRRHVSAGPVVHAYASHPGGEWSGTATVKLETPPSPASSPSVEPSLRLKNQLDRLETLLASVLPLSANVNECIPENSNSAVNDEPARGEDVAVAENNEGD